MNFECKNIKDKIVVILMCFGFIALYIFAFALLQHIITLLPLNDTFLGRNIYLLLAEAIITSILILIFHNKIFRDIKDFKKNYKHYIKFAFQCWLIGFIIMIISNLFINLLITKGNIASNESTNRKILTSLPIYSILSMSIFGPICEEILFRLSFKTAFKNITIYCLFTGILFAGLHVANGVDLSSISGILKSWKELLYFIPYSSLGIAFGYAFFKTDNICTSICMHIFHNSLSVAMIIFSMLATGV